MCVHKELQNKIHNSSVVDLVSYPEQFSNILTLITSSDFLFLIMKILLNPQPVPVTSSLCQRWRLILFPWFQKFGSNQSKPEFTVDLRGGSVDWASKDKSSKKHVIEVSDTAELLSGFTLPRNFKYGVLVKSNVDLSSLSWRLAKAQSYWSSLRSTVSSTTGTGPSQRPSTHMWGGIFH